MNSCESMGEDASLSVESICEEEEEEEEVEEVEKGKRNILVK